MILGNGKATAFLLLVSFFSGALVISAVLAVKTVAMVGLVFPAGVLAYALTFPVTDVIGEIWGRRTANRVVLAGFITLCLVFFLIAAAIKLPRAPFWGEEEAFRKILGQSLRIIVASLTAYLISQFHDVWAFHYWRRMTGEKWLWLRNNLSTMVSQLVDTAVFISIAFWGIAPVGRMMGGQYLAKVVIAVLDTPLVYGIVWVVRRVSEQAKGPQSPPAPPFSRGPR